MKKCDYCGHPPHQGVQPKLTSERAEELFQQPGFDPSAAECEAIHVVWARVPGDTSYIDAFHRIRERGFAATVFALPLRKGDRVKWRGQRATVTYACVKPTYVEAYGVVLDSDPDETLVAAPAELTEAERRLTRVSSPA